MLHFSVHSAHHEHSVDCWDFKNFHLDRILLITVQKPQKTSSVEETMPKFMGRRDFGYKERSQIEIIFMHFSHNNEFDLIFWELLLSFSVVHRKPLFEPLMAKFNFVIVSAEEK